MIQNNSLANLETTKAHVEPAKPPVKPKQVDRPKAAREKAKKKTVEERNAEAKASATVKVEKNK